MYVLSEEEAVGDENAAVFTFEGDKDALKRNIYRYLSEATGKSPKWGILTGIRPVKLAGELSDRLGCEEAAKKLMEDYLIHPQKVSLVMDILDYQRRLLEDLIRTAFPSTWGYPFVPQGAFTAHSRQIR